MRIDHIQLAIPAGSEEAQRDFWCSLLGFSELEKPEALKTRGGAWFKLGTVEVHLGVEVGFVAARKAHPAFRVPELGPLASKLANAGHSVRWDKNIEGRKRFFTDDPAGNRLEFIEE